MVTNLKLYWAFYRSGSQTLTVGGNKWIFASSQDEARDFLLEELKTMFSKQLNNMEDEMQLLKGWELQEYPVVGGIFKMRPDIGSL